MTEIIIIVGVIISLIIYLAYQIGFANGESHENHKGHT
jgi:hypothetical protein